MIVFAESIEAFFGEGKGRLAKSGKGEARS